MIEANEIVYALKNLPDLNYTHLTSNNNLHFTTGLDHRKNTIYYGLYKDNDGFYFRRCIRNSWFKGASMIYQLFRSRGNKIECHSCSGQVWYDYDYKWEHFATIEEAIARFNKYVINL